MFSRFRQCIKSCFDERKSYGVTSGAGRRPSLEGAPAEDSGIPESVLTGFKTQNPYVDTPCYSDDANDVPNRVGCQQDDTSQWTSGTPSKTAEISDDVLRTRWAREQHSELPRRPSRVHFSNDIPKPGDNHLNETPHGTSEAPMASSKATSSSTKEYSGDSVCIHELETIDKKTAEHDDTDTGLTVQKITEETIKSEEMADTYNEETIGSKFEAVHTGKSVLKIGTRKRDSQVEDLEIRSIITDIVRL